MVLVACSTLSVDGLFMVVRVVVVVVVVVDVVVVYW